MEQLSLFTNAGQSKGIPSNLFDYRPGIFDIAESDYLMEKLLAATPWQQHITRLYDKEVITPRLMAWYGDVQNEILTAKLPGLLPWNKELKEIEAKVVQLSGIQCNCVLLNYYRDGNDSVAWHSDKEAAPGRKTVVGSVTFGQVRNFDIRNKHNHSERYTIRLEHGSFLLMKAGFQDAWEHRIPKSTQPMRGRLNLTFRQIG
jgi:alkylated DNA repair dioxygenase AlkB